MLHQWVDGRGILFRATWNFRSDSLTGWVRALFPFCGTMVRRHAYTSVHLSDNRLPGMALRRIRRAAGRRAKSLRDGEVTLGVMNVTHNLLL